MLKDINPCLHFDPEEWVRRRGKTGQNSFLGESFGTMVKKLMNSPRECCKLERKL